MARLNKNFTYQAGQSLAELIIAIGVGVVIILGGIGTVSVYLRVSSQDITYQKANFLAQEIIDRINVTAEGDWNKIVNATTSSYLTPSSTSTGFLVQSGQENIALDNTNYVRYFYTTSVCRDAMDFIVDCVVVGSINDPFTRKIQTVVGWSYRGAPTNVSLEKYVTRTSNEISFQDNWIGGSSCPSSDSVFTNYNTGFCSSTPNLDFSSNPGVIKIQGF